MSSSSQNESECLQRASELPIYKEDDEEPIKPFVEQKQEFPTFLVNTVHATKSTITKVSEIVGMFRNDTAQSYHDLNQKVKTTVQYLREEENLLQRTTAIGLSTVVGFLFGLRGGILKKIVYATAGGLGMGAVCYPDEAKEYTSVAVEGANQLKDIVAPYVIKDKGESTLTINKDDEAVHVQDPQKVIEGTHDEATSKSCHCPIGACLGHSDEPPTSTA